MTYTRQLFTLSPLVSSCLPTAAGTTSVGFGTTGTTPGGFSLGQPAATSAASTSSGFSFSSAATVGKVIEAVSLCFISGSVECMTEKLE